MSHTNSVYVRLGWGDGMRQRLTSEAKMDPPIHGLKRRSMTLVFCTSFTRILYIKRRKKVYTVRGGGGGGGGGRGSYMGCLMRQLSVESLWKPRQQ